MLVLTFQTGSDRLALEVHRVREVVPCVNLRAVACSPPWLAGVFIYRGEVVPVIDLHRLLGTGEYPRHLSTRIILVTHEVDGGERLVGLLAAQVVDVREMSPPSQATTSLVSQGQRDLGPVLADGGEIIRFVELNKFLPELNDQRLALLPKEAPA